MWLSLAVPRNPQSLTTLAPCGAVFFFPLSFQSLSFPFSHSLSPKYGLFPPRVSLRDWSPFLSLALGLSLSCPGGSWLLQLEGGSSHHLAAATGRV